MRKSVLKLRWRVALAFVGLLLVLASVAVIAYAFWPLPPLTEQFRPAPTLFAPPQSALMGKPWA